MKSAGGLLCAVGLMIISGCTLTIVNNDEEGYDLEYAVQVDDTIVAVGTIPFGESVDVNLGGGGSVWVDARNNDGYYDFVLFDTVLDDTEYTVEWTHGFTESTRGSRPGK